MEEEMVQYCRPKACFEWPCISAGIALTLILLGYWQQALAKDITLLSPRAQAEARRLAALPPVAPPRDNHIAVDHSGRKEAGKASIYSHAFDGRTMANGRRYDPRANVAASKSLPLGTIARVTNLETGKSTEVRIEDRGPFVDGRVVDLTPHAAREIGLTAKEGLAPVIVAPITVPQPDGTVRPGAGAAAPEQNIVEAGAP
jgi:rare lipoprotein A